MTTGAASSRAVQATGCSAADAQANPAQSADSDPMDSLRSMSASSFLRQDSPGWLPGAGATATLAARAGHRLALRHSDDPASKVAALLFPRSGHPVAGVNTLPPCLAEPEREAVLSDRRTKELWMAHAERAAIHAAARAGTATAGAVLVSTKFPCHHCAQAIVAAGVVAVASPKGREDHPNWGESFAVSARLMRAAGLDWLEIEDVRKG